MKNGMYKKAWHLTYTGRGGWKKLVQQKKDTWQNAYFSYNDNTKTKARKKQQKSKLL